MDSIASFDWSLTWPRELFVWEARRVLTLQGNLSTKIEALLGEAFADADVTKATATTSWPTVESDDKEDRELLQTLILDVSPVRQHQRVQYWLERQGNDSLMIQRKHLSESFLELVEELRDIGYFPKVLPEGCVDNAGSWDVDPSDLISRAIRYEVSWPDDLKQESLSLPDDVLYSIIEYFHDQAQRPRVREMHGWNDCGYHYKNHNKASGGVVYRWRINELLDSYGVGLRLGNQGDETGKLIQHASLDLDDLGDQAITGGDSTRDKTVAEAIQLYRKRAATTTDRRAAVGQLANYIEHHRKELNQVQFVSKDEQDLFNIFNNFMIRHGNKTQKDEYGDEYLDWIFWTSVSAIQLIRQKLGLPND